ncbi:hypothetical protein EIP91_003493 [Steccherinum ochraceum]|uniref:DUF676 domain-containing protein n=1 Tax=Steccherinum ochraceum TaxID=92696 RepID=A0A4R0RT62_9APHY|nr:hypothetical protein EIP91_003493 [Steccherinum ochraceum]
MAASTPEVPATPPDNIGHTEFAPSQTGPQDLLLVVFIHGFKGTDTTFGKFPERLRHVLSETIPNVVVETIVFPAYETKGELNAAVVRFADWLTNLTVQREVANGVGGGAGKAKIILCGHSMGGLLAADALIEFVRTRPDPNAPLWPNIIACLAYDTPYFGLHPHVFKNTATQAAEYVKTAQNVWSNLKFSGGKPAAPPVPPRAAPAAAITAPPAAAAQSSVWSKWAPAAYAVGGALIAGGAAATAYYRRDDVGAGYSWATDHMKYVGNLWDEKALTIRMDDMLKIEKQLGVMFRVFYSCLPPNPPQFPKARTFVILPPSAAPNARFGSYFLQAPNSVATDEISAHTGMFDAKTNDGYYELGLITAHMIRDVVITLRTLAEPVKTPSSSAPATTKTEVTIGEDEGDDDEDEDEDEEEDEDKEEEQVPHKTSVVDGASEKEKESLI